MKNTLLAFTLTVITLCTIIIFPDKQIYAKPNGHITPPPAIAIPQQQHIQQARNIDLVFVLDTTGSMGGLIEAAKQKIWSIASTMASANQQTHIRIGLVAYRDRGDAYVTKVVNLTDDLDSAYAELMQFQAQGGGDTPEDVNQGLYDAVTQMTWNDDANTYKSIFLVGDAPAQEDYDQQMQFPQIAQLAQQKGIVINAIQCGRSPETLTNWQTIARLGNGDFFQVAQNGNAVAVKTPYDKQIAELALQLEQTRLLYGDAGDQAKHDARAMVSEKLNKEASVEAKARRALFNITSSGKKNLYGDKDLVDDVLSGKTDLEDIDKSHLPKPMQSLSSAELNTRLSEVKKAREALKSKIDSLGKERQSFVTEALAKKKDRAPSLDEKLYATIKKQAREKGIEYESTSPNY